MSQRNILTGQRRRVRRQAPLDFKPQLSSEKALQDKLCTLAAVAEEIRPSIRSISEGMAEVKRTSALSFQIFKTTALSCLEDLEARLEKCQQVAAALLETSSLALWQYEQAPGLWHSFDVVSTAKLEASYAQRPRWNGPQDSSIELRGRCNTRVVDLQSMSQRNLVTGKTRPVRRQALLDFQPQLSSEKVLQDHLRSRDVQADHVSQLLSSLVGRMGAIKDDVVVRMAQSSKDKMQDLLRMCGVLHQDAAKDHKANNSLNEMLRAWQLAKTCSGSSSIYRTKSAALRGKMQNILRGTSHSGHGSECDPMSRALVTKVSLVVNPKLWEDYCSSKEVIRSERRRKPPEMCMSSVTSRMQALCSDNMPWGELDNEVNEIWAYHGTKSRSLSSIANVGLDPKRCLNGYYGRGFYLGQESCKSMQYTDAGKFADASSTEGCLILFRVTLGQPEYAKQPDSSKIQPAAFCNSVVVNTGQEGGPPRQEHQEILMFNSMQAYPDLVVFFRIPSLQEARPVSIPLQTVSVGPQTVTQLGSVLQQAVPSASMLDQDDEDDEFPDFLDDCLEDDCIGDYGDLHDDGHEDDYIDEYIGDYDDPDDGNLHFADDCNEDDYTGDCNDLNDDMPDSAGDCHEDDYIGDYDDPHDDIPDSPDDHVDDYDHADDGFSDYNDEGGDF
ncbi:unnamed protein product [Polarella glacialis]|uniref:WWE domain-containing protein n=1 Tax=Polarella glacialis TaxID=89957 RepID=A0A813EQL9_POLGL|nr:unnamed protein product [Polarella glacialis]